MSLICDRCKASQFGEKRENIVVGPVDLIGGVAAILCNRCVSEWRRRVSELPAYLDLEMASNGLLNYRAALHAGRNDMMMEGAAGMAREMVKAESRLWNAAAAFVRGEPVGVTS